MDTQKQEKGNQGNIMRLRPVTLGMKASQHRMIVLTVNNELGRTWKNAAMT
jgi:hypothetical protein